MKKCPPFGKKGNIVTTIYGLIIVPHTHTHDVWKMENIGILYHKQRWVIFLIVACSPMGPCTYYSNSNVLSMVTCLSFD